MIYLLLTVLLILFLTIKFKFIECIIRILFLHTLTNLTICYIRIINLDINLRLLHHLCLRHPLLLL